MHRTYAQAMLPLFPLSVLNMTSSTSLFYKMSCSESIIFTPQVKAMQCKKYMTIFPAISVRRRLLHV